MMKKKQDFEKRIKDNAKILFERYCKLYKITDEQIINKSFTGNAIENTILWTLRELEKFTEHNSQKTQSANKDVMAQILKQEIYCDSGKLKHLVNDKKMADYIFLELAD